MASHFLHQPDFTDTRQGLEGLAFGTVHRRRRCDASQIIISGMTDVMPQYLLILSFKIPFLQAPLKIVSLFFSYSYRNTAYNSYNGV